MNFYPRFKNRSCEITLFEDGCFLSVWTNNFIGRGDNAGFTLLPINPFRHLFFSFNPFGYDCKRLNIGLGLFSMFIDFVKKTKNI